MSSFTKTLSVKPLGRGLFRLLESISFYESIGVNQTLTTTVEKGFITDFASIPFLVRWLIDPMDEHIAVPAVFHDKNYRTGFLSRFDADFLLIEMMKLKKSPEWKILLVYIGLRLFGWKAYNSKRS